MAPHHQSPMHLRTATALSALLLLAASVPCQSREPLTRLEDMTAGTLAIVPSIHTATATGTGDLVVDLLDTGIHLRLSTIDLRSTDFQIEVVQTDRTSQWRPTDTPSIYRGEVIGAAGSRVIASLHDGHLRARLIPPTGPELRVTPVRGHGGRLLHVVHLATHSSKPGERLRCGTVDPGLDLVRRPPGGGSIASTTTRVVRIAIDTDREFFEAHGSDVRACLHKVEALMNEVDTIFEQGVQLRFRIARLVLRTAEPDPFDGNNGSSLLDQLDREWNGRRPQVDRAVTHLFSPRRLFAGNQEILGIARTDTACRSAAAFGVSRTDPSRDFAEQVATIAHELGHNFGARHCDPDCGGLGCFVMCSTAGGCNGNQREFGPCAQSRMQNYISIYASTTCFRSLELYVDRRATAPFVGTQTQPFRDILQLQAALPLRAEDVLIRSGSYPEVPRPFSTPVRLRAQGGPVTIGR